LTLPPSRFGKYPLTTLSPQKRIVPQAQTHRDSSEYALE
jgi:hypothetical protein